MVDLIDRGEGTKQHSVGRYGLPYVRFSYVNYHCTTTTTTIDLVRRKIMWPWFVSSHFILTGWVCFLVAFIQSVHSEHDIQETIFRATNATREKSYRWCAIAIVIHFDIISAVESRDQSVDITAQSLIHRVCDQLDMSIMIYLQTVFDW